MSDFDDPIYCDVMGRKHEGTTLTNVEILGIGAAVLSWVLATKRLGHVSPASTLDYTTSLNTLSGLIVRDFVAWTCGRRDTVPGDPEQRLLELLEASDWEANTLRDFPLGGAR